MLVDEVDAVFRAKSEQAEALRGVLNAGNRRGSYVVRGTQDGTPAKFGTFCAKVLAGINNGRLPDTIADRAVTLRMQRKRPEETVEDLFPDELADQLDELRRRLADWAAENINTLAAWRRPERVEGLDDRLQEAWDPLLAIADLAQAGWPEKARNAATALAKGAEDTSEAAHGHLLIEALRSIFGEAAELTSKAICEKLNADEELPFGGYSDGTGIVPRGLAKLLKPYGIKPKVIRLGAHTPRGYEREDFAEVWQRYAPRIEDAPEAGKGGVHTDPSKQAQQAQHPQHPSADGGFHPQHDPQQIRNTGPDVADKGLDVADGVAHENPDEMGDVADVADVADVWTDPCAHTPKEVGEELSSEVAPCSCHQRTREWRLRGPAASVGYTYLSRKAYREAAARSHTNGRGVIAKGPASGWVWQATPADCGHPWQCALCHPPAQGLDVEYRTPDAAAPAASEVQ